MKDVDKKYFDNKTVLYFFGFSFNGLSEVGGYWRALTPRGSINPNT